MIRCPVFSVSSRFRCAKFTLSWRTVPQDWWMNSPSSELAAGQASYLCSTEYLQTSSNTGRLCPAWQPAKTREKPRVPFWHGRAKEFEQSVAVGGYSDLMLLPLLLLQHSSGPLQRFVPCCAVVCINPCSEVFAISVVTGPSRRVWEAEEGKKEGETKGRKLQHCTQDLHWHSN